MNAAQKLDLARRYLQRQELTNEAVTFRGVSLDHFGAEELRKIIALTMRQCESDVRFYKTAIDGYRALYKAPQGESK